MEDPAKELREIILSLTESNNAALHKATVEKYFLSNAAFEHPLCNVKSGPNSRDSIKRVYAVYKVATKDIHIDFRDITVNESKSRAVIELEESVSPSLDLLNLMRFHRIKIVTILDLWKDTSGDGRYYIAKQYDVFPADKLFDILPFGFLYGWWRSLATITGNLVGRTLQVSGLWATE